MKTYEKVVFVKKTIIQPNQLKLCALIFLSSCAFGLIPFLGRFKPSGDTVIVPAEATLWQDVAESQ